MWLMMITDIFPRAGSVVNVLAWHSAGLEFKSRSGLIGFSLIACPYHPCELWMGGLSEHIGLPASLSFSSQYLASSGLTWMQTGLGANDI